jgi:hypothetical protein
MNESNIIPNVPVGVEGALEGQLRRQLEALGIDQALGLASSVLDRRCVEAAHTVLTDEEAAPGYIHAGFAMTALPHKRTDAIEWIRDGADIRLRIESGKSHDGAVAGIPFGYVARLILLYLQTERRSKRDRARSS